MKILKQQIILLSLLLISLPTLSQEIIGSWNGILKVQGLQLRIVFHISKNENGFTSKMDSPDQGAKNIPSSSTSFENQLLEIKMSNINLEFSGTLKQNNTIEGTLKQSGQSFPMILTKEKIDKEILIRPQEPLKPFPYRSENFVFKNKSAKIKLAGTLTYPNGNGPFPVVILISGSGPQNRDSEIFGHKSFLVIADYLTKNGIAVLRYDDRGTAKSTGTYNTANSLDLSTDVEAAINYLKKHKKINPNKIGLIGHSEGGMIAPIVASKNKDVNFIVLMAGPGIKCDKLLLLQEELIAKVNGQNDEEIQKSLSINRKIFEIINESKDDLELKNKLTEFLKKTVQEIPKNQKLKELSDDQLVEIQYKSLTNPWMKYFLKFEPKIYLEQVKCPVLAINGEKDLQVPSEINLLSIHEILENSGNHSNQIVSIPNLNHLFQECTTGSPQEYPIIEQTFSPIALEIIKNWIEIQIKN
jgi:pimeloyl-ACP methyl ester carboxylesterase